MVVLALSLLLGLQPVTTDLYLPALPAMTQGFGATMPQAQLTLTALLLAFGLSQLVWGPLSDRFGRRPVLLWGLALYAAASAGSVFSVSMTQLILWRTLQGVAMGAGVMGARAIVRDLYAPSEGASPCWPPPPMAGFSPSWPHPPLSSSRCWACPSPPTDWPC